MIYHRYVERGSPSALSRDIVSAAELEYAWIDRSLPDQQQHACLLSCHLRRLPQACIPCTTHRMWDDCESVTWKAQYPRHQLRRTDEPR